MKAQSDEEPERIVKGQDKAHYNCNIEQIEIKNPDGTVRTTYKYDYVEIEGKLTKAKIIKALEDGKLDTDEEYDPVAIENDYKEAKESIKLSNIASMSYAQLDTYINNNVTNLVEAKAYLKKLSKVVLAILKYQNVR